MLKKPAAGRKPKRLLYERDGAKTSKPLPQAALAGEGDFP